MRAKRALCLILFLATVLVSLPSCGGRYARHNAASFEFFDTVTELSGYTESRERFDEVKDALLGLLSELHREFDIYGGGPLAAVNATVGESERKFNISEELYGLLSFCREAHALTGGKVNAAMGSVLSIWHDCRYSDTPRLPDGNALSKAAAHTDINSFELSEEDGKYILTVSDPYLSFDVGALAKGYAAKKAVELLRSLRREGEGFLLNLGGMVCPVGEKPRGEAWQVGIEYPTARRKDGYLRTVSLREGSLVTSSAHLRAFTVDGKSYGHIIDPDSLYPPEYFASVTVFCPDPALGDALSTALFCMTESEGRALLGGLEGCEAMWVYADMTVSTTKNFEKIS